MRLVLGILLLLAGVGALSCRLESGSLGVAARAENSPWVRTVDGWERADNWLPSAATPPKLNPLVVASGQALFSLLALAVFSAASRPASVRRRVGSRRPVRTRAISSASRAASDS